MQPSHVRLKKSDCDHRLYLLNAVTVHLTFLASRRLHDRALESILHSELSFNDTNPIGRILSRFGKDCDIVDSQVTWMVVCQVTQTSQLVATCIICSAVQPALLLIIAIVVVYVALACEVLSDQGLIALQALLQHLQTICALESRLQADL